MDNLNEREELINRILEEKGVNAFDDMVKLLEDEDENVREIAAEVLYLSLIHISEPTRPY